MSSESPLIAGVRQAFRRGESSFARTYRNIPISANDPEAYSKLGTVSPPLPALGDVLSGTGYAVTDIQIQPTGTRGDVSDVVVTYSTLPNLGSASSATNQPSGEVSFEIYPETLDIEVVGARAVPLITPIIETDGNGAPTNNPPTYIDKKVPTFEEINRTFRLDRARVVYTITGTAGDLGIPTGFNVGTVPLALAQQRFLHVIAGVPLLFRIGSIRQVRRATSTPDAATNATQNTYAISYEWLYDAGVAWSTLPDGWTANAEIGPVGDKVAVTNALGQVRTDTDGNTLAGVFVPYITAPQEVGQAFGNPSARYIVPPYCETDLVMSVDHSFPYPSFIARPLYTRADVTARESWQNLPGVQ